MVFSLFFHLLNHVFVDLHTIILFRNSGTQIVLMQKQYIVPTPPLPPPFMTGGGMKFFRNGYNGELGNFHWKLGGSQEWGGGVGFIMGEGGWAGRMGKF